jgi:hypothetical protein
MGYIWTQIDQKQHQTKGKLCKTKAKNAIHKNDLKKKKKTGITQKTLTPNLNIRITEQFF